MTTERAGTERSGEPLTDQQIVTAMHWIRSLGDAVKSPIQASRIERGIRELLTLRDDLIRLRAILATLPEPVVYEDWEPLGCVMCDGPLNVDRTVDHAHYCPWLAVLAEREAT
jgi:hypothetical protein